MKMKCLWNYVKSRLPVLLALACLISCVSTSSIYARYVTEKTEDIILDITGKGTIELVVTETNGKYTITNKSNIPVYVRFAVVVNWTDDEGNIFRAPPSDVAVTASDYTCTQIDKYYYCNKQIPAKTTEAVNVTSFTVNVSDANIPIGYTNLDVQVLAEGIQCYPDATYPDQAARNAWRVTFNGTTWSKIN